MVEWSKDLYVNPNHQASLGKMVCLSKFVPVFPYGLEVLFSNVDAMFLHDKLFIQVRYFYRWLLVMLQ